MPVEPELGVQVEADPGHHAAGATLALEGVRLEMNSQGLKLRGIRKKWANKIKKSRIFFV